MRKVREDPPNLIAASAAFFALLALFPALSAAVSLYGLIADPQTLQRQLAVLRSIAPPQVFEAVAVQGAALFEQDPASLGVGFGVSIVLAIWSLVRAALAIMSALNLALGRSKRPSRRLVVALMLAVSGFALLLVSLFLIALPSILEQLVIPEWIWHTVRFGRWPALALLVLASFSLLYHYAPNMPRRSWGTFALAPLAAAACSLGGAAFLSAAIGRFGNFGAVFGSLSSAVVLMIWLYVTMLGLCFGGILHVALESTPRPPPKPPLSR